MDGSSHAAGDSVVGSETRIKKLQQSGFILHNDGAKARLSRVSLGVDKLSCCLRRWAGASVGEKNPGRNGRPALMITAGGRALSNASALAGIARQRYFELARRNDRCSPSCTVAAAQPGAGESTNPSCTPCGPVRR